MSSCLPRASSPSHSPEAAWEERAKLAEARVAGWAAARNSAREAAAAGREAKATGAVG